MDETFKRTLMVCAAVSAFGGSAFIGDRLLESYIRSKQVAPAVAGANAESAGENSSQPGAAVELSKPKASLSFSFGK